MSNGPGNPDAADPISGGGGHGGAGGPGAGPEKYFYFVDDVKYDWDTSSISGAQIRARIPNLQPGYQLFLETRGNDPDTLVQDNTSVPLSREQQGAPRLYTVAPATFGSR